MQQPLTKLPGHARNNSWAHTVNQSIKPNPHYERFNDASPRQSYQPTIQAIEEDTEVIDEPNTSPLKPTPNELSIKPNRSSITDQRDSPQKIMQEISLFSSKRADKFSISLASARTASSNHSFSKDSSLEHAQNMENIECSETLDQKILSDLDSPMITLRLAKKFDEITFDSPKSLEQELAEFQPDNSPRGMDTDTINYLISLEESYRPDPNNLASSQPNITEEMREILIDWMMEVSNGFGLARETLHFSVNYVDRYLCAVPNVKKNQLQLIGVTALFLAAKYEEIKLPRLNEFAKTCAGMYTAEQIEQCEIKMIKALNWKLTPPTMNNWAQWYLNQWDLFIERIISDGNPEFSSLLKEVVFFRKQNDKSYFRFREIMQLLDACLLNVKTLKYSPRTLLAAFMFLAIGSYYGVFDKREIFEKFSKNGLAALNKPTEFHRLFAAYLEYCFGFQLEELVSSVEYAAKYFQLPLNFEPPSIVVLKKSKGIMQENFEEFLSYQTYHPKALEYLDTIRS